MASSSTNNNNMINLSTSPKVSRKEAQQIELDYAIINWDNITKETCTEYSFSGTKIKAKVLDVYDGDSVTVASPFFSSNRNVPFMIKCRLYDIDTPEIRTRNQEEKEAGKAARDELRRLILDQVVWVTCGPFDKFGRMLVAIETLNGIDINSYMIEKGHALQYSGGTRLKYNASNYLKK